MDRRHANAIAERQIGPILTSVIGGGNGPTTGDHSGSFTHIFSPPLPSSSESSVSSTTSTTSLPSSSASLTPSSAPASSLSSTTSSRISFTSPSSSLASSTSTYETTPSDPVLTVTVPTSVTAFLTTTLAANNSSSPTPLKAFLQDKPLSSIIFALAGALGLIVVVVIATLVIRGVRNNRLRSNAISFNPSLMTGRYSNESEQGGLNRISTLSTGHGYGRGSGSGSLESHGSHGQIGRPVLAPPTGYGQEQGFYGQALGYGQRYGEQAPGHNHAQHPAYRPNPTHSPSFSHGVPPALPQLSSIGAAPSASDSRVNTILQAKRTSIAVSPYSPPTSPTQLATKINKRRGSHSMDLDLHEALPVSPTLPATFGSTDNDEWDSVDEGVQNLARTLRIVNQ